MTDLATENAALRSLCAELVAALDAIECFGSDTLSGPATQPDNRQWHRDGVREMTLRARAALAHAKELLP